MKKLLVVLLMCALTLPLFAEGAQEEEAVTISYFSGRVETVEWTDNIIEEFEQEYPGIRVEHEFQKDASNVIKMKLASNEVPDLTTVVNQEFIDQGVFMDLSDLEVWDRV